MQSSDPLQTRLVRVLGPAAEQLPALLPHLRVGQIRRAADAQPLQQRLVGKGSLEARAGILDQAVEQDQGADLAMHVAVLELLANGARGLGGARGLDGDDFDEVGDAADVVLLVGLGGERLDGDRDGGVGLLLDWVLVERSQKVGALRSGYRYRTGWNMLGCRCEAQLATQERDKQVDGYGLDSRALAQGDDASRMNLRRSRPCCMRLNELAMCYNSASIAPILKCATSQSKLS